MQDNNWTEDAAFWNEAWSDMEGRLATRPARKRGWWLFVGLLLIVGALGAYHAGGMESPPIDTAAAPVAPGNGLAEESGASGEIVTAGDTPESIAAPAKPTTAARAGQEGLAEQRVERIAEYIRDTSSGDTGDRNGPKSPAERRSDENTNLSLAVAGTQVSENSVQPLSVSEEPEPSPPVKRSPPDHTTLDPAADPPAGFVSPLSVDRPIAPVRSMSAGRYSYPAPVTARAKGPGRPFLRTLQLDLAASSPFAEDRLGGQIQLRRDIGRGRLRVPVAVGIAREQRDIFWRDTLLAFVPDPFIDPVINIRPVELTRLSFQTGLLYHAGRFSAAGLLGVSYVTRYAAGGSPIADRSPSVIANDPDQGLGSFVVENLTAREIDAFERAQLRRWLGTARFSLAYSPQRNLSVMTFYENVWSGWSDDSDFQLHRGTVGVGLSVRLNP